VVVHHEQLAHPGRTQDRAAHGDLARVDVAEVGERLRVLGGLPGGVGRALLASLAARIDGDQLHRGLLAALEGELGAAQELPAEVARRAAQRQARVDVGHA
jgi:hypothetical protein